MAKPKCSAAAQDLGLYTPKSTQNLLLHSMACTIDFRRLDEGFGGKTYKRKRNPESAAADADEDAAMEIDESSHPPPAKRSAVPSSDNPNKPVFGQPSYDGVIAGRVSGRKWKQPRTHRASAAQVSLKGTTYQEREQAKLIKKAYRERMTELKDEIKKNKEEKRRKREEREQKKRENIFKSGTKLQVISNKNTVKKIAKTKQRKHLKAVDPKLINQIMGKKQRVEDIEENRMSKAEMFNKIRDKKKKDKSKDN